MYFLGYKFLFLKFDINLQLMFVKYNIINLNTPMSKYRCTTARPASSSLHPTHELILIDNRKPSFNGQIININTLAPQIRISNCNIFKVGTKTAKTLSGYSRLPQVVNHNNIRSDPVASRENILKAPMRFGKPGITRQVTYFVQQPKYIKEPKYQMPGHMLPPLQNNVPTTMQNGSNKTNQLTKQFESDKAFSKQWCKQERPLYNVLRTTQIEDEIIPLADKEHPKHFLQYRQYQNNKGSKKQSASLALGKTSIGVNVQSLKKSYGMQDSRTLGYIVPSQKFLRNPKKQPPLVGVTVSPISNNSLTRKMITKNIDSTQFSQMLRPLKQSVKNIRINEEVHNRSSQYLPKPFPRYERLPAISWHPKDHSAPLRNSYTPRPTISVMTKNSAKVGISRQLTYKVLLPKYVTSPDDQPPRSGLIMLPVEQNSFRLKKRIVRNNFLRRIQINEEITEIKDDSSNTTERKKYEAFWVPV